MRIVSKNTKKIPIGIKHTTPVYVKARTNIVEDINALIRRGRQIGVRYTKTHIFEEGAKLFLRQANQDMDRANAGEFHAKRR